MVWKYFYKKRQDALARGTFEKPLNSLDHGNGNIHMAKKY
jgi:hypothetical protein